MPQDRTLKAIKSRSRSEQVSVVSLLLLPLLGMCCLLIPDTVTDALPYLLGGLMAVSRAAREPTRAASPRSRPCWDGPWSCACSAASSSCRDMPPSASSA